MVRFFTAHIKRPKGRTVPVFLLFLLLLSSSFSLFSCSRVDDKEVSQKKAVQLKKGLYRIELSPPYATKDSSITATVKGARSADVSYQWMVNGVEIEGATAKTFSYAGLMKHDEVQVKVSVKDRGGHVADPLVIANIFPRITRANLVPLNPGVGDTLAVFVETFDGDGDYVDLSYAWYINDEPVEESDERLVIDREFIKKGDKVSVKITPTDGEQQGQSITLKSYVVNSPPDISHEVRSRQEGRTYTARIAADDPDGDRLTYILKKAPEGMTIDSEGGTLNWEISPEDKKEHEVIVSVTDGFGGEATIRFIAAGLSTAK
jgi:hypothetical protein